MNETGSTPRLPIVAELAKDWWMPVLFGVLLVGYSFVVLSFTIDTIWAVAVLLGVGLLLSGIANLTMASMVRSGRWLLLILGVIDIGLALTAFFWPGATFLALARLVGWVLLFRGLLDVMRGLEARRLGEDDWWWFVALGVLNIAIAFWAVRYDGRSIVLLVLWVGIALLSRGIAAIVAGFELRRVGRDLAS